MDERTEPTDEEIKWWRKLKRVMDSKPETMILWSDGILRGVCSDFYDDWANGRTDGKIQPLDLEDIATIGAGDPWL